MKLKDIREKCRNFNAQYRVDGESPFKLSKFDPSDIGKLEDEDKPEAAKWLQNGIDWLAGAQEKLYADGRWSLLIIFQALDAAGKDGAIKHVLSGVNPQGCRVNSFKKPTSAELAHDWLWRCSRELPSRGQIGIFNRSYYEDVLVTRVHSELIQDSGLPKSLVSKSIWKERMRDICNYEDYLARNGTAIVKIFLNISPEEQKRRFLQRLEDPKKLWKASSADFTERQFFDDYQKAYQDCIQHTASRHAPWYVVPADHKWFARLVTMSAIIERIASLDLHWPTPEPIPQSLIDTLAPNGSKKSEKG